MIIKTFIEPPIDNNNYLLIDERTKEAALVDCSAVDDSILEELDDNGAVLKYILLTHGHFDHIAGIRPNMRSTPSLTLPAGEGTSDKVKIFMHKADLGWLNKVNNFMPMFGKPEMSVPQIDHFVEDGEVIKLGDTDIKVIHTPGHTQGGVCYYTDGSLFSGDTIFRECVGRCDLEGGDFDQIVESIENKIFTLPPETVIYPGHGSRTTVGWEKEHNKFL